MHWFVIRHPETGGVGVIAEPALSIHKGQGWLRVSEPLPEHAIDEVVKADYADSPDLDAPTPKTKPSDAPAKTGKES